MPVISREGLLFLVIGVLTVLIDGLMYRGLQTVLPLAWAKAGGFLTGSVFAYVANRRITFRHNKPNNGSLWRFALLYGMALLLNTTVNSAVVTVLSGIIEDKSLILSVAFVLATGTSAVWNFMGMKWFVFKARQGALTS